VGLTALEPRFATDTPLRVTEFALYVFQESTDEPPALMVPGEAVIVAEGSDPPVADSAKITLEEPLMFGGQRNDSSASERIIVRNLSTVARTSFGSLASVRSSLALSSRTVPTLPSVKLAVLDPVTDPKVFYAQAEADAAAHSAVLASVRRCLDAKPVWGPVRLRGANFSRS
jgi:uncharacterized membrane protein